MAAGTELSVWGSDFAKITPPKEEGGRLGGRIHVWTRIDKDGKWFDSQKEGEAEEREKGKISIPEHLNPNYRTFQYALLEQKHRLLLEYENEAGDRFGPTRAHRFFSNLLSPRVLGEDFPEFAVTVVPEEQTLARILAMPRLRKLEIFLLRPNADDLTAEEILKRLADMGAKSEDRTLVKSADAATLNPDTETRQIAEVASTNGHVSGEGRDAEGNRTFVSTKDHPKQLSVPIEEHESPYVRFWSASGLL